MDAQHRNESPWTLGFLTRGPDRERGYLFPLGPLGCWDRQDESLLIIFTTRIRSGRDSTPGGYIPTLETKQRECWKLRDSRLRSQILIREYTVNLPTLPSILCPIKVDRLAISICAFWWGLTVSCRLIIYGNSPHQEPRVSLIFIRKMSQLPTPGTKPALN